MFRMRLISQSHTIKLISIYFINVMIRRYLYGRYVGIDPISTIYARYLSKSTARKKLNRASNNASSNQNDLVDLDIGQPHLWYTKARGICRKVICHVGPTNSGTDSCPYAIND
jgi:hypothetical protein